MSLSEEQARLRGLYERHFDLVWAALAVYGVRGHEREDLIQEVWLLAHRRLSRLRGDASARAWLWSIARNIVRRHRRATQRRDRKLRAVAEVRLADQSVGLDHEGRVAAEQVLAALPVAQREVIVLTHHVGYSGPEIAELLGVSLNTVHSRLRLAKARLRDDLKSEETQAARRNCWSAVVAGLASPPSSLLVPGWVKAAAIFALALVTIAWTPDPRPRQTEPGPNHLARSDVDSRTPPPSRADPSLTVESPPKIFASAEDPAMGTPHHRALQPAPESRSASPKRRSPKPDPSPHPPKPPSLSADVQLVHQGLAHNRAGRHKRALATLERHARKYPQSPVWDARESGRVRALCALGRFKQAKDRARRALERGGSSIAINNSLASCSVTRSAGSGHSVSP